MFPLLLLMRSRTGLAIATWLGSLAAVLAIIVAVLIAVLAPATTTVVVAPGPCCRCDPPTVREI